MYGGDSGGAFQPAGSREAVRLPSKTLEGAESLETAFRRLLRLGVLS